MLYQEILSYIDSFHLIDGTQTRSIIASQNEQGFGIL